MDSSQRQQRKRKSRGSDIFEVSERDLSPEPEEPCEEEPESKISRSEEQDISEFGQNNGEHNLTTCRTSTEPNTSNDAIALDNGAIEDKPNENDFLDNTDTITLISDLTQTQDLLEEGEVDELPSDNVERSKDDLPCISIKFSDQSIADLYKKQFCTFIQSFVELHICSQDDTTIDVSRNPTLSQTDWVVLDSTVCTPNVTEETTKQQSPKKRKKKKKQKDLFVLDTNPNSNQHQNHLKYTTKFEVRVNASDVNKNENSARPPNISVCFNCGEQHALKDCQEPRNMSKINANRQAFMNQKNKSTRYYVDDDQKYGHLKPGKISLNLRKALGLKRDELPGYIYKMRHLGYPPGWLEEAIITDSELDMLDFEGNNVTNTKSTKNTNRLDLEKIVEYPGFNVPAEKRFRDAYHSYNVRPFSQEFSIQEMVGSFNRQFQNKQDDLEVQDMNLDDTNEVSEIEETVETKDSQKEENVSNLLADSEKQADKTLETKELQKETDLASPLSPTLTDLQKEKDCLLEELQKSNQVTTSDENTVSSINEEKNINTEEETSQEEKGLEQEADQSNCNSNVNTDMSESEIKEADNKTYSSPVNPNIKNSIYGTPILKSASPYTHLPHPDNFSRGVSAVIDFENLPNSTGKYEQMTGVLQKVRNTLKNLPNKT